MRWDAEIGWLAVPAVVALAEIDEVLAVAAALLVAPEDEHRPGDKPASGTRHLVDLDERIPLVADVVGRPALTSIVDAILGEGPRTVDVSYRCAQPGFGAQQLHCDDLPKLDDGPDRVATAIIALVDFTARNGGTRVVAGSHRRPDLQRHAGSLADHPDQHQLTGPGGTAFVFSGHLLHSGTRNESTTERPALQVLWRAGARLVE